MQKFFSILLTTITLLFLTGTFFMQYEFLFITRLVLLLFTIQYIVIEVKKAYFAANRKAFILISSLSILLVTASIFVDASLEQNILNYQVFLIPVFVFILIVISYKDLYGASN